MHDMAVAAQRFLDGWHDFIAYRDPDMLGPLLSDKVVIKSPAFFTPKGPKAYVSAILAGVTGALENFHYTKEWIDHDTLLLEFEATIDGLNLKGIDRIIIDDHGRMIEIEVLIRPANALQALAGRLMTHLAANPPDGMSKAD